MHVEPPHVAIHINSKVSFHDGTSYHTYGFHPRSDGFTKRIPALETVAGVAVFKCPISNMSLMELVSGTLSLLASVRTCTQPIRCHA